MRIVKDNSITRLLIALDLDAHGWVVRDHWDSDLCAIGIAAKDAPYRLAYVSTFDKPPGIYDVECEIGSTSNIEDYTVVLRRENVDYATLLIVLQKHLAPSPLPSAGASGLVS
jgi:hypothetical protein